uniref:Tyrosine-protein kinase n=1 Tax=Caenorhabditis japonica TaxID=281687 RepID=A0A8R1HYD4_CAEJA
MARKVTDGHDDSENRGEARTCADKKARKNLEGRSIEVDAAGGGVPLKHVGSRNFQKINKASVELTTQQISMDSAKVINVKKPASTPSNSTNTITSPVDPMASFSPNGPKKMYLKDYNVLEEQVRECGNFHGFVCREDLPMMLPNKGDWLMRMSIHPVNPKKIKKPRANRKSEHEKATRSIVVSVHCKVDKTQKANSSSKIRSFVIWSDRGQFWMAHGTHFDKFHKMVDWASNDYVAYKDAEFRLQREIQLLPWEFKHDDVELLDTKLGEGAFGEVRIGKLTIQQRPKKTVVEVAVKMLKNASEGISRDQIHELLHEARMMRILSHPNVLKVYGIAVLWEPPFLMTELCSCGALREYLKDNRETITLTEKLNFVMGAARGVEYIHSQKMIHRDLAVRNIFLTAEKMPKVSDFGLARQTDRYEMKEQCKIPVRYLAPETLENYIFTPKTDVFSFGCVIWEIYENGQQPFHGKNATVIRNQVRKREYLKLTADAPPELRKLVAERIFVADPENRCAMNAIVKICETLAKVEKS